MSATITTAPVPLEVFPPSTRCYIVQAIGVRECVTHGEPQNRGRHATGAPQVQYLVTVWNDRAKRFNSNPRWVSAYTVFSSRATAAAYYRAARADLDRAATIDGHAGYLRQRALGFTQAEER